MAGINWVGKDQNEGRVGRGSASVPVCETRWIVPVKPYQAPKGSEERVQKIVLIGFCVAVIIVSYACLIIGELGAM